MGTYRREVASCHPPFAPDSNAACAQLHGDLSQNIQHIVYTAEDDKVIDKWLRKHVETAYHSLGTCKMGRYDEGGVADTNLSVYGVQALKVADLSIPPQNVATNTMNTAVVIEEKAADICIQELGIKLCDGTRAGNP